MSDINRILELTGNSVIRNNNRSNFNVTIVPNSLPQFSTIGLERHLRMVDYTEELVRIMFHKVPEEPETENNTD